MSEVGAAEQLKTGKGKIVEFPKGGPRLVRFQVPEDKILDFPHRQDVSVIDELLKNDGVNEAEVAGAFEEFNLSPEQQEDLERFKDTAEKPSTKAIKSILEDMRNEGQDIPDTVFDFLPDWLNETWWGWKDDMSSDLVADDKDGRFPTKTKNEELKLSEMEIGLNAQLQELFLRAAIKGGLSSAGENLARGKLIDMMVHWGAVEQSFEKAKSHPNLNIDREEMANKIGIADERRANLGAVAQGGIPVLAEFMKRYYEIGPEGRNKIKEESAFTLPPEELISV